MLQFCNRGVLATNRKCQACVVLWRLCTTPGCLCSRSCHLRELPVHLVIQCSGRCLFTNAAAAALTALWDATVVAHQKHHTQVLTPPPVWAQVHADLPYLDAAKQQQLFEPLGALVAVHEKFVLRAGPVRAAPRVHSVAAVAATLHSDSEDTGSAFA